MAEEKLKLIGRVILRSTEIESALRRQGASGNGIRELAESLEEYLSADTMKLINYISSIRNRVAHEGSDITSTDVDLNYYDTTADFIIREVESIDKSKKSKKSQESSKVKKEEEPPEAKTPAKKSVAPKKEREIDDKVAVEPEMSGIERVKYWAHDSRQVAFIPGLHFLFPL